MTKRLRGAGPLLWLLLGWVLAALYILGPRVALNRGLDRLTAAGHAIQQLVGAHRR
ncbi:hypothetical protein ABDK56_07085 [Sphingomonas sp. ASV193]|uniref:hypothetical protein n=1 Tax=Sphingomonas sp. ASV193 TaxID=3144405 RepID=UPI0032E8CB80